MLHYVGDKLIRKRTGFVGDFCPFCRQVVRHTAREVRQVRHTNYISFDKGNLIAVELDCPNCGAVRGFHPQSIHPTPSPPEDLVLLASSSSPLGTDGLLERLRLEEQASSRSLSSDDREDLLAEPFLAMEYVVRLRDKRHGDFPIGAIMVVCSLFALFLCYALWMIFAMTRPLSVGNLVASLVVTIGAALQTHWTRRRLLDNWNRWRLSKPSLHLIARSLHTLAPTTSEIAQLLENLRAQDSAVANRVNTESVMAAVALTRTIVP